MAQPRIHPDVEFQASLLAGKVARKVLTLEQAVAELAEWQTESLGNQAEDNWREIEPRALIITHMFNTILKRDG